MFHFRLFGNVNRVPGSRENQWRAGREEIENAGLGVVFLAVIHTCEKETIPGPTFRGSNLPISCASTTPTRTPMVSVILSAFIQPDAASAPARRRKVTEQFTATFTKLTALLETAEADMLPYLAFPP
jgi:hypothetical protein